MPPDDPRSPELPHELTCRSRDKVRIGADIRITVVRIARLRVVLAIDTPKSIHVERRPEEQRPRPLPAATVTGRPAGGRRQRPLTLELRAGEPVTIGVGVELVLTGGSSDVVRLAVRAPGLIVDRRPPQSAVARGLPVQASGATGGREKAGDLAARRRTS